MAQQTDSRLNQNSGSRSRVLTVMGALALGLALLFVFITPLAGASHGEVDLHPSLRTARDVTTSFSGLEASHSASHAAVPNADGCLPPAIAPTSAAIIGARAMPQTAVATGDSDTSGMAWPSAGNSDGPTLVPGWYSSDGAWSCSVAWGDVDSDGDLDLATADWYGPTRVYINIDGVLETENPWTTYDGVSHTNSIAWGDMNGDGYLDLAVGNGRVVSNRPPGPNMVFLNSGRELIKTPYWVSIDRDDTRSIAWGDMNNDGLLDLAAGNWGASTKVYTNVMGMLAREPRALGNDTDQANSVAWGDMDGNDYLDLAVGNWGGPVRVYTNLGGVLQQENPWVSRAMSNTSSIAWGDMDGNGYLDLAVGNWDGHLMVYTNTNGVLQQESPWISRETFKTYSVSWGDVDGDGDLDLAAGIWDAPNMIFLNEGGVLQRGHSWTSGDGLKTASVSWGDVDGDGDLDLAAANGGTPNEVYLNMGSMLQTRSDVIPDNGHSTRTLAWGDVDGDGDLDLVFGNSIHGVRVYTNTAGVLQAPAECQLNCNGDTFSVAWGDVNGDGDLDLAVGTKIASTSTGVYAILVYTNVNGVLQPETPWVALNGFAVRSLAWGDVNGDGELDLAVGNDGPDKVYFNEDGVLRNIASWRSADDDDTQSIAWGDVDGDGDLDLATGNNYTPDKVYLNIDGRLQTHTAWPLGNSDRTNSIAWGDMDGDGDLDLAAGNGDVPDIVYLNVNGVLTTTSAWTSSDVDFTQSIAWGDMDGDGDLDLVTGNRNSANKVYYSEGGVLQTQAGWVSEDIDDTRSIALGDVDGDGDLDLVAGNTSESPNRLYLGNRPGHPWGVGKPASIELDLRSDPVTTFSQRTSTALAPADYYALPGIRGSGFIPITYTLYHPLSETVRLVRVYFSPDGSLPRDRSAWREARPASTTITTNLTTSPYPTPTITNTHVFTWDVLNSDFMGQSDNVIVHFEALPNLKPTRNGVPGPFQRPYVSAQTYRFRVRGSQVRVMNGVSPVEGAIVYQLPSGQTGPYEAYRDRSGHPYQTDKLGYLQGYGEIREGDQLVALAPITPTGAPISHTNSYSLYVTNAVPITTGVAVSPVSELGVQTLTVSSDQPLVLFNLDVSLEWDARNDPAFISQLTYDIQRASEFLYDWSNGQAALGKVTVYHARQHWQDAHVLIYANNRFRPAAMQGGIITGTLTERVNIDSSRVITYLPGQVAMGPVWNRYGDPGSNLGEDWPRAFAHELAHYALFLDDNYLGLNDDNLLITDDSCPGAMTDPYRDDFVSGYGEFHPELRWTTECSRTLSHHNTRRSDWATIGVFYRDINTSTENAGPSILPLDVTQVTVVSPTTPVATLAAPFFLLMQDDERAIPTSQARSYLFQDGWAVDLGEQSQGRLLARGAKIGDRLCVYDLGYESPNSATRKSRLGCETIQAGDTELRLVDTPGWHPEITIAPLTSRTLAITVTNVISVPVTQGLIAKLYPLDKPSATEVPLAVVSGTHALTYTGILTSSGPDPDEAPSFVGLIQIWVDEPYDENNPRRETVTDYVVGGNPARIWSRGARIWSRGVRVWSGGARIWSRGAPVSSADGQVAIYDPTPTYKDEWFLTVQASSVTPDPWMTLVGKAYQVSARAPISHVVPDLSDMSITFNYLGSDVPPGEEQWLAIYYWDEGHWEKLGTQRLDTGNNVASATMDRGPGVYALMSTIEIPLHGPGWDVFGYPIFGTRPVTEALISISDVYSTVHTYDPTVQDPFAQWQTHDAHWPSQLDTLPRLAFGKIYWIDLTESTVLRLRGWSGEGLEEMPTRPSLPATYYGAVTGTTDFTPTANMIVTAQIGQQICGRSQTRSIDGQIMYAINVLPEGPGVAAGCGIVGRQVTFHVGSAAMMPSVAWNDERVIELNLQPFPSGSPKVWLPTILR